MSLPPLKLERNMVDHKGKHPTVSPGELVDSSTKSL